MVADKAQITRLLKTGRGQLDGILKMVEEDRYCMDIANQLMATVALLKKVEKEIMTAHIRGCVAEAIKNGDADEKAAELAGAIERLLK